MPFIDTADHHEWDCTRNSETLNVTVHLQSKFTFEHSYQELATHYRPHEPHEQSLVLLNIISLYRNHFHPQALCAEFTRYFIIEFSGMNCFIGLRSQFTIEQNHQSSV